MDITSFVTSKRDRALLVGDYNSYRAQCSRQLLSLRRRLGRTTPKNAKFSAKAPVTVEDVAKNHEFVHLLLIQAERAWAHAMHIKSTHTAGNASKGISGSTRRHIITKLHRAASYASDLMELISDRSAAKATESDFLEAKAYALSLSGAEDFERQVTRTFEDTAAQKTAWNKCLVHFSTAHVIYSALLFSTQREAFREVISGTIDPSIRYAAYQSKIPRTVASSTVAKRNFPKDQTELLALVQKLNPNALSEEAAQKVTTADGASTAPVPTSIHWRKRSAPIADAAIGQALAAAALAASNLSSIFSTASEKGNTKSKKLAAAYDPILTTARDAVDAVHRCIGDLTREGVAESDSRMQDLRVSDLAANYGLISWRIGRNRVLISESAGDDGTTFAPETRTPKTRSKRSTDKDGDTAMSPTPGPARAESSPHRLARLSARVVLLDSTLQSIDAIAALPGATRDTDFQAQLTSQRAYFQALKCLNVGYSYKAVASGSGSAPTGKDSDAAQKRQREALALFARAGELLQRVDPTSTAAPPTNTPGLLAPDSDGSGTPPTLLVAPASVSALRTHLDTLTRQQRGLCALIALQTSAAAGTSSEPLINHLMTFPPGGRVDLGNLVTYPPRLEPVPVKPIFLDLAWNYIRYPGEEREVVDERAVMRGAAGKGVEGDVEGGEEAPRKKGWFGFGRG